MYPWFCNMKGLIISLWLVIMSMSNTYVFMFDASMSVLDLYFVLMSISYVYFIYMSNASMSVLVSDAYSTCVYV